MPLVVVPAKPLAHAKARLAPALNAEERRLLCLAMLADVTTAAIVLDAGPVVVVASDTDAEAVARACGARVVWDPMPAAGLNPSLEAAIGDEPDGVLIVSSDVASAAPGDLAAMIGDEAVALAVDEAGTGTNALWRKPGRVIPLAFGPQSAAAHRDLAAEAGVAFRIVKRPGLALDLDLPAHLTQAWNAEIGTNTRSALLDLGFPGRISALEISSPKA